MKILHLVNVPSILPWYHYNDDDDLLLFFQKQNLLRREVSRWRINILPSPEGLGANPSRRRLSDTEPSVAQKSASGVADYCSSFQPQRAKRAAKRELQSAHDVFTLYQE